MPAQCGVVDEAAAPQDRMDQCPLHGHPLSVLATAPPLPRTPPRRTRRSTPPPPPHSPRAGLSAEPGLARTVMPAC